MKTISMLTWIACGFFLMVVGLAIGWFQLASPDLEEVEQIKAHGDALRVEASKLQASKDRVTRAEEKVAEREMAWQEIIVDKSPGTSLAEGGINLAVNPIQLPIDTRSFRDSIQRAVNRQVKAGGVTVVSGPTLPIPTDDPRSVLSSFYNFPALDYPVAIFELGTITVKGNYSQITENVRAWASMPNFLATAGGLQIQGTSPTLTGTYNVVLVAFIKGQGLPALWPGEAGGVGGDSPATDGLTGPGGPGGPGGNAPAASQDGPGGGQ